MTVALDIEKTVCHQCFAVLDMGDNFCRHCGAGLKSLDASRLPIGDPAASSVTIEQVPPEMPPARPEWSENPYFVMLLVVVLGPLGLPLVWRSRRFSIVWKIALTTLVAALTLLLFWKIWHDVQQSLAPLRELWNSRGL